MASVVIGYGFFLAVSALAVDQIASKLPSVGLTSGVVLGGLVALCGLLALAGRIGRSWPVLTVAASGLVILAMMIEAWFLFFRGVPATTAPALLLTFLMLTTVAMVVYLLHGERSGEFYRAGSSAMPHAKSK